MEVAQSNLVPGRSSLPHSQKPKLIQRDQFVGQSFDPESEEIFFQQEELLQFPTLAEEVDWEFAFEPRKKAQRPSLKKASSDTTLKGLRKRSLKKAKELDMPPTPTGHDWHVSEGGWNLVKSWSEKDGLLGQKIKKERYAGYLSKEAWQVMKEYEYEKIIAKIGQ